MLAAIGLFNQLPSQQRTILHDCNVTAFSFLK